MELLDAIIDFFWTLYNADKRPEARKLTIGCFIAVLILFMLIAVIVLARS